MTDLSPQDAPAFRRLRRALIVRRLRRLDPVLRVELALIALLAAARIAWPARLSLDRLARRWLGPRGALEAVVSVRHESEHSTASRDGPTDQRWQDVPNRL